MEPASSPSGLSLLFLALGLTSLFGASYVGQPVVGFDQWDVPGLSEIPVVGEILFQHDPLLYLSFVMVPLVWFGLFKTRIGLLVRTAGERSRLAHGARLRRRPAADGAVTFGGHARGPRRAHSRRRTPTPGSRT